MNRYQRDVVLAELSSRLLNHDSWCGETHLQKATYVLQELLGVPTGFEFILYKHGPFSFDLRDELTVMRADGLLELRPMAYPYGPSLVPTLHSASLRERFAQTVQRYETQIEFAAMRLGGKGVAELERLATALYVTLHEPTTVGVSARADELHQLKPHVSVEQAMAAVSEIDEWLRSAPAIAALNSQQSALSHP